VPARPVIDLRAPGLTGTAWRAAAAFDALCSSNPGIERIVSVLLADRIDILSRRLLETMYESLDRRVYRRLLEPARSYEDSDGTATTLSSQSRLADLAGATRPSVDQVSSGSSRSTS
jgi:CRP/FNR family cyclic AMP-dependent transcriptional regulator